MKEWVLFALFLVVGLGMLIAGIVYTQKEKGDMESAKLYRVISTIGVVVALAAVLYRVLV